MKKWLLFICAVALLGSCKKSNKGSLPNPADAQLSFAAQVNGKEDDWGNVAESVTRGAVTNNGTIENFSVFCFYTGVTPWDATPESRRLPNKMFNVNVTKNSLSGVWEYNPPQTWDGNSGHYFTFMGYSPHSSSPKAGGGIELVTEKTTQGSPKLKFTTSEDVTTQTDLLVVNPRKDLLPVKIVNINLEHALSRLGFSVKLKKASDAGTQVTVTSIKLKISEFGNFYKTGTLDLLTKTWGDFSDPFAKSDMTLPTPVTKPILKTDPSLVIAENGYLFLVPQPLTANLFFVDFEVSTKIGTNSPTSKTYANIKIPAMDLLPSKSYNFLFEVEGDTNIKLEKVIITAWEVKPGGGYDI